MRSTTDVPRQLCVQQLLTWIGTWYWAALLARACLSSTRKAEAQHSADIQQLLPDSAGLHTRKTAVAAGGELFEQLSAKGYYRERDAAHIMRTVLQVRAGWHSRAAQSSNSATEQYL
jgi:hypothetical protein